MRQDLTEIVCILDRSGSMAPYVKDTIGGFNSFIEKQKEVEGDANVSVYLFDHEYISLFENKSIKDVTEMTTGDYFVGGSTALIDAMGRTINSIGKKLYDMPEWARPSKVVFMIITDGEENASVEFTNDMIKKMIKQQEEIYKWQFIFLSANLNQFEIARKNWDVKNSFSYTTNNTGALYSKLGDTITSYRGNGILNTTSLNYDLDDRTPNLDKDKK